MTVESLRPKGPSLNALRAFEASARLKGFSAAAEELSVTPGAIVQLIKKLEDWAGAPLFVRTSQGVELTALGASVFPRFVEAFDMLGDAVTSLRAEAGTGAIAIAAQPSIAQCWLVPRLAALGDAGVSVTVSAIEYVPDLRRSLYDISVFFEKDNVTAVGDRLRGDTIYPVCTPDIAKRLQTPEDLAHLPCLFDEDWQDDWSRWLTAVAPGKVIPVKGPKFSLFSMALDAARSGAGVLMGHDPLVTQSLERGELVRPFDHAIPLEHSMTLRIAEPASPAVRDIAKKLRDL